MWNNDYDYQWTLINANHYYKISPYKTKNNQHNPKQEKYKSVSHGYSSRKGETTQGYVMMYHHCDILESK
jgi:hypothetical protein